MLYVKDSGAGKQNGSRLASPSSFLVSRRRLCEYSVLFAPGRHAHVVPVFILIVMVDTSSLSSTVLHVATKLYARVI